MFFPSTSIITTTPHKISLMIPHPIYIYRCVILYISQLLQPAQDSYCNLQPDRERHLLQTVSCKEYLNERWGQLLQKARQSGPPCSWIICFS